MADLVIRRAGVHDLPELVRTLGPERFFTARLAAQQDGRGFLLVAFADGAPVGRLYVRLEPADEPEVRERLPGVALLQHLQVVEGFRQRGIGRRLIGCAERLLRQQGHARVALGVVPDNIVAVALYQALQYADWGYGEVVTTREVPGPDGTCVPAPEQCHIFVKVLGRVAAEEAH